MARRSTESRQGTPVSDVCNDDTPTGASTADKSTERERTERAKKRSCCIFGEAATTCPGLPGACSYRGHCLDRTTRGAVCILAIGSWCLETKGWRKRQRKRSVGGPKAEQRQAGGGSRGLWRWENNARVPVFRFARVEVSTACERRRGRSLRDLRGWAEIGGWEQGLWGAQGTDVTYKQIYIRQRRSIEQEGKGRATAAPVPAACSGRGLI